MLKRVHFSKNPVIIFSKIGKVMYFMRPKFKKFFFFQVGEMLQQALQNLPDISDFDSKLIVPVESFENSESQDNDQKNQDPNTLLDDIMCEIVDSL